MPLDVLVLLAAAALDVVLLEPPARLHPVVWMGRVIGALQGPVLRGGRAWQLVTGAVIAIAVPLVFGAIAWAIATLARELGPVPYVLVGALVLRTTFTVTGLTRAAGRAAAALEADDLARARGTLRDLVSRPTHDLGASHVAGAAIASVAENTTDSWLAPWLAFALAGLPGAVAYRAINTLDSMIGYHGRFEYAGKAAARLDDLVNLVPARLSAGLLLVSGALTGRDVRGGWRILRRDRTQPPSPNGGWTMSVMAGLLGVVLEKIGHYRLGDGLREPNATDIHRANTTCHAAAALGCALTVGVIALLSAWTR